LLSVRYPKPTSGLSSLALRSLNNYSCSGVHLSMTHLVHSPP
jgi:hypothetical protein